MAIWVAIVHLEHFECSIYKGLPKTTILRNAQLPFWNPCTPSFFSWYFIMFLQFPVALWQTAPKEPTIFPVASSPDVILPSEIAIIFDCEPPWSPKSLKILESIIFHEIKNTGRWLLPAVLAIHSVMPRQSRSCAEGSWHRDFGVCHWKCSGRNIDCPGSRNSRKKLIMSGQCRVSMIWPVACRWRWFGEFASWRLVSVWCLISPSKSYNHDAYLIIK